MHQQKPTQRSALADDHHRHGGITVWRTAWLVVVHVQRRNVGHGGRGRESSHRGIERQRHRHVKNTQYADFGRSCRAKRPTTPTPPRRPLCLELRRCFRWSPVEPGGHPRALKRRRVPALWARSKNGFGSFPAHPLSPKHLSFPRPAGSLHGSLRAATVRNGDTTHIQLLLPSP